MNNGLSLLKIITGLSKTLNIANQLLPLYSQIKPIIQKRNDIFSSIQTFNNKLANPISNNSINNNLSNKPINNNGPTFFQ